CGGRARVREYSRAELVIGTLCRVRVYSKRPAAEVHAALEEVFTLLQQQEMVLSAYRDDSALAALNAQAGSAPVVVDRSLYALLERALFFAEKSGGAFNPALGAVVKLWNIGFDRAAVPDPDALKEALTRCDFRQVHLRAGVSVGAPHTVQLAQAGMQLDLGAIAKGFLADKIVQLLTAHALDSALVDLGGNIFALGLKYGDVRSAAAQRLEWNVGIRDPHGTGQKPALVVSVRDCSVVTSGAYERFFERDGVRYHHIIDPVTGFPAHTDVDSVSIFAPRSTDADALATACFVLGYEKSCALLREFPGVDALFIFPDKRVRASAGIVDRVRVLDARFVLER
uniref:FAD:protein FMN transferase n=1 Tax=Treponema pallidum (strain Nichols) TaxID=243276 RepID=UPI0006CE493E|nr:Chain A, FAD:protein FMN transferase [Treponema pallidum subsp. pallidum str. Nichols]4XDU_A Chain A, FAD:protein FMN transferase [Treponema pallidum subsp. pallidum str. Nichols]